MTEYENWAEIQFAGAEINDFKIKQIQKHLTVWNDFLQRLSALLIFYIKYLCTRIKTLHGAAIMRYFNTFLCDLLLLLSAAMYEMHSYFFAE